MAEVLKAIGLMSGTSLDGVDAALLETDGEFLAIPGSALTVQYEPSLRAALKLVLAQAKTLAKNAPVPASIAEAEKRITEVHAVAVKGLLQKTGMRARDVALIGFHGQTILHRPEEQRTWQIGDGAALARATGIAVVNDFRTADVAAGGQGAPLVPLYHAALVRAARMHTPVAVVNIGGVANVTYVGPDVLMAFDTGPGNAPIDDWAEAHSGQAADHGGALARQGRVDERVLEQMLAHPYFAMVPPKSLDRFDFGVDVARGLSAEDGAATLTAFTAAAIARAAEQFPHAPLSWIICGGGRHNPVLMDELKKRIGAPVLTAEDAGWRGDFIEAEAFAYLAVRSVKGLPLSLPTTTGVPRPMTGGTLHKPG